MNRAAISSLIKKIHKGTKGTGMKDDVKAVIKRAGGGPVDTQVYNYMRTVPSGQKGKGWRYWEQDLNPETDLYRILSRMTPEEINNYFTLKTSEKGFSEQEAGDLATNPSKRKVGGHFLGNYSFGEALKYLHEKLKKQKDIDYPSKFAKGGYTGGGDQPAALSEGEYVIPADVVSMLGDGNSDAGAKILEQFCTQIRKEKGKHLAKGKQAPPLT